MPAQYNKENLPTPNNSKIIITESADEYVAVIRFGGYSSDEKIKENKEKIKNWKLSNDDNDNEVSVVNHRWLIIKNNVDSDNEASWRLAIMEADIILNEIIDIVIPGLGTMGEKMKTIDNSKMKTINIAWEAHKIRNRIAHDGGNFILSRIDARKTINMYEEVFNEFGII